MLIQQVDSRDHILSLVSDDNLDCDDEYCYCDVTEHTAFCTCGNWSFTIYQKVGKRRNIPEQVSRKIEKMHAQHVRKTKKVPNVLLITRNGVKLTGIKVRGLSSVKSPKKKKRKSK